MADVRSSLPKPQPPLTDDDLARIGERQVEYWRPQYDAHTLSPHVPVSLAERDALLDLVRGERAENTRLREALREIVEIFEYAEDQDNGDDSGTLLHIVAAVRAVSDTEKENKL